MERGTIPKMSRCRREGRHNCPIYSRKISFQQEQQSSIDQDAFTVFQRWWKRGYQLFRWCRFHYLPYCTGFGYHRRKGSCFNYRWHWYFCHAHLSLEVRNEKYILPTKNAQRLEYCILISKARQGKRSHSFCSRDDRMWHNISTLWKEEEKLFEPNFEIKDVTVFVNDDARYMGRTEWGWWGCSQMLCRDVHFWEKWWNSNFSSVGNSLFFKIIQYLLSIYL